MSCLRIQIFGLLFNRNLYCEGAFMFKTQVPINTRPYSGPNIFKGCNLGAKRLPLETQRNVPDVSSYVDPLNNDVIS